MGRVFEYTRDGLTFEVDDAGPLDGPVVLLLHGFPAGRSSWAEVTPLLVASGYRVLAPDQRGYSPRARPAGRRAYRGRELVRDIVALLDAAGAPTATVVGHDWGGFVAWWLAMAAPRRVRNLVVVSTPHPAAFRGALATSDQALRSWYIALFQLPVVPEKLLLPRLRGVLRSMGLPREQAERYAAAMREPGVFTAAINWYRALALPGGGRIGGDGRVHVPTRFVWGNADQALGRRAAELTGDSVAADYTFVELDEGHWIPERAASRLAREILEAATL